MKSTREFAILLLVLLSIGTSTNADMMMTISEVNDGVLFEIDGTLDLSVFPNPPGVFSTTNSQFFVGTRRSGFGLSSTSTLSSTISGDPYFFPDDETFAPVGILPAPEIQYALSNQPQFSFGYSDRTRDRFQDDFVVVPDGYVSESLIDLSFFEPNTRVSEIGLSFGDFWGVSFPAQGNDMQSITFRVVPEPCGFALLASALMLYGFSRRRGKK